MGLFSWLFGKPSRVATEDVIWLTDAARGRAVANRLAAHLAAGRSVLLVAQFPATLAAFGKEIISKELPHVASPDALTPDAALALAAASSRVIFGLARNLRPSETPPSPAAPASPLPVIVLERHLIPRHDNRVVAFAEGLGGRAAVEFHSSIDDPLMQMFAGEWVRSTLRSLGMKEDEPIESRMVARRLKAAQGKVAQRVSNDQDADSAREWVQKNWAGSTPSGAE